MKKTKRRNHLLSEGCIGDDVTSEDVSPFVTSGKDESILHGAKSNAGIEEKESKPVDGFNAMMTVLLKSGVDETSNLEHKQKEEVERFDLNQLNKHGNIPLILAAKQGWEDGMDFLLSQEEIDVDFQTPDGQTALSVACAQGHSEIVKKLISCGCNLLLEDKTESTAICYAVSQEHTDLSRYIYQQMSRECKNAFVKRRIELLSSPKSESKSLLSYYNRTLFPVLLDIKRNMIDGITLLLDNRLFANIMACVERCQRDPDMLCAVFRLCSCLIYSEEGDDNCVNIDLAEQFVENKGPETVLKLVKSHSQENSFQVRIAAMVAIQAMIEVGNGTEWIKENIMGLISLFTEFNSKIRVLNCWQDQERTKVCVVWKKFKDFFLEVCEKSGIYNVISEEQSYSNKGSKNHPKCQKKRNRQNVNKPWMKILEKQTEVKQPDIIYDPLTKYNFGPCTQTVDDEMGEFETVIHNKREKNMAKSKRNSCSRKIKQAKNNLEDANFTSRRNESEQQTRKFPPNADTRFCNREPSRINVRKLFSTPVPPTTDTWLQHQTSFRGRTDSIKNNEEQEQKGVDEYWRQFQMSNDTSWADGINSSNFSNKWKGPIAANDDGSRTPISPPSYFDSDDYHSEHESSDEEIVCRTITGRREETIGGSNNSSDYKVESVKEKSENNEASLTLPNSFVDILVEVMTNMMKTLMKKCLYWPDEESDFCEEPSVSKATKQSNPQWQPQSHRWQSLLSEMVKVPKVDRTIVNTIYYVAREEYVIGRGRFINYVGLTKDSKEVAIKKFCSKENRQVLNQIIRKVKFNAIENKNILPISDVQLTSNWTFFIVELCECNLQEYLTLMGERSSLPCIGKELISQLLEGLSYLHNHQPTIIHGSLRPTNILISLNGNLVLSNFGLLEIWPPYCGIIDRSLASHVSVTKCSWRPRECLVAVNTHMAKASYTPFSDMQLSGMVVHFILTRGNHPFGSNDIECQINIARGRPVYRYLGQEMNDMIGLMLSHDPNQRPMASMALKHPYFWYSEKRLNFLIAVASQPEMTTECCDTVKTRIERACVEAKNWVFKVHPQILQDTFLERSVKKTVADLLRLIFNCVARYRTFSPDVQHLLSSPALYFTDRFPSLVVTIYKVIRESRWKDRTSLSGYF